MGLFGGRECEQTCRKAKWNVPAGLKQLKIAKGKVELKKKKKLTEYVSWAILPREKPEECIVKKLHRLILCRGAKTTEKKRPVFGIL